MKLSDLDPDVLSNILLLLCPESLASLSSTSKFFLENCSRDYLWERLCKQRWKICNSFIVRKNPGRALGEGSERPAESLLEWRSLYGRQNGWREPQFQEWDIPPDKEGDFISALHPFIPSDVHWSLPGGEDQHIAVGCADSVQIWQLKENTHPKLVLRSMRQEEDHILHSIAPLPGNRIATGSHTGAIHFFHPKDGAELEEGELQCSTILQASTASCVDMHYCPANKRMYTMHDCTFHMLTPIGQRNVLQAVDVESQTVVASAHEFSEQYELICMAPLGQSADWGNELVAGAVHGSFCTKCYHSGLPSLCHHKPGTSTSALCVFDLRSGVDMVQRFGTHHRSLYPHICCARGTYIFTSHVGKPLCVYDRRSMSMPVWEEEQLGNYSHKYPESMPFPKPTEPSEHNAMYLDIDAGGDTLIGRAANGMMWLWDLTATLGWQSQPVGAHGQGSWLHRSTSAPWEDGTRFGDWPTQLGAWPCDGLPQTHIQSGSGGHLIGLCTKRSEMIGLNPFPPEPEELFEYVACARLI